MMFIRASLAASLLLASGGMAAAIPLDGFVSFDDPYRCYTSKDFGMLLNGVIRWEELSEPTPSNDIYKGTLTSPAVPANYRKQIGKPTLTIDGDEYRATIPLRGTWQGLPLRSLVVVQWVESEGGFYLVFDATREQVLDAANNAGFKIPPSGSEYRDRDPDIGVNIGVESYDGLEALYCIDVALAAVHVPAVPVDTTVCDVLANPSAFDGKLVRFRAGVLTDWHHGIALMHRDCRGAIQLASTGAVPAGQTEAFDAAVGTPLKGGFDRTAIATFTGRISWKPDKKRAYMDNPLKLSAHLIHQIEVSHRWSR